MSEIKFTEHDEFIADIAYLNGLADFMLETVEHRLPWPSSTTVWERLKADVSSDVRKAVFGPWWTFQQSWHAA